MYGNNGSKKECYDVAPRERPVPLRRTAPTTPEFAETLEGFRADTREMEMRALEIRDQIRDLQAQARQVKEAQRENTERFVEAIVAAREFRFLKVDWHMIAAAIRENDEMDAYRGNGPVALPFSDSARASAAQARAQRSKRSE